VAQPALVLLWCGEGLADKFLEAHAGVRVTQAELYELDAAFFQSAARVAAEVRERREERRRERAENEGGEAEGDEADATGAAEGTDAPPGAAAGLSTERSGPGDASGEPKRRRRRRRGRRGRGPRPGGPGEATPSAGGPTTDAPPPAGATATASGEAPEAPPAAEPVVAPPGAAGEGSAQ
jgi:ribonuclease E